MAGAFGSVGAICYNPVMSTEWGPSSDSNPSSSCRLKLVSQVRRKYIHVRTSSTAFAAGKQREISKEDERR